jgi:Stress responsive A/B Barrel Domain
MFHHVALLRFHEGIGDAQIAALEAGLATLPGRIDALIGYRFGRDAEMTDGAWDYAIVADFADPPGYEAYRDHPDHIDLLANLSGPITAVVARVQFES